MHEIIAHIYYEIQCLTGINSLHPHLQQIGIILSYQARALRALGLLLADGTPTVGGGKTF